MKQFVVLVITLLSFCCNVFAYDFSSVNTDGTTLYYTITSDSTVDVSSPSYNKSAGWINNESKPTGAIVIPSTVEYQNKTYTVTAIDSWAFEYCPDITSITIPNTVTFIGTWAFWGCVKMDTINFPSTPVCVESLSFHGTGWYEKQPFNKLIYLGNTLYKYKGCTQIKEDYSVIIPDSTNSIAGGAFYSDGIYGPDTCHNYHLVSVTIPPSVKYIGNEAFCYSPLKEIILPDSLEHIGYFAFTYSNIKNIVIPKNVKTIDACSFGYNDSLKTVTILAEHLFSQYTTHFFSSDPFTSSTNINKLIIGDDVTSIPNFIFQRTSSNEYDQITTLIIPNSVKRTGNAFSGCTGLKSLTIGTGIDTAYFNLDNLIELNYNAVDCHSFDLKSNANFHLSIGPNVKSVPDFFLSGCTNFTESVSFPAGLERIGQAAFANSGVSGVIDIPESVTTFGMLPYFNCTNLTGIICRNPIPPKIDSFIGNYSLPLKVPYNSVADYKTAPIWQNYASITGLDIENYVESIIYEGKHNVHLENGHIIVEGVTESFVVLDIAGRIINNELLLPGVYFVIIGKHPAQKVLVK